MIGSSRLVKAAVLGGTAAAICSLFPPAATAVAAQKTAGTTAIAPVPAVSPSSGSLAGTVRAFGGPGLAGICVTASGPTGRVGWAGSAGPTGWAGPTGSEQVFSQAGGRFVLTGLRPGAYRIGFRDCGQPPVRYADAAQSVLVAPGRSTFLSPVLLWPVSGKAFVAASARAIRAKLRADGRTATGKRTQLSGTVTSSAGQRLAGICVFAVQEGGGPFEGGFATKTGKNGTYAFTPGAFDKGTRWRVNFWDDGCGNKGNFAPQWWKRAATRPEGKILRFGKGTRFANIDASLGKGASISGTVRAGSKSGPGLPGACVQVDPQGGQTPEGLEGRTGPGGKYLISGLGTGRYVVQFGSGCGDKGSFGNGKNVSVSVKDGKTTRGVDGFLPRAAELTGTVTTGPHRRPLAGICVESDGVTGHVEGFFDTRTGPDGRYSFTDLSAGRYQVSFFAGCGSKGSFAPQFYKGQVSPGTATTLRVRSGELVAGINADMHPGGIVTGTVTSATGKKLTGICVILTSQAVRAESDVQTITAGDEADASGGGGSGGGDRAQVGADSGGLPFGGVGITVNGRYRVTDLPLGDYSVTFSSGCKPHQPTEATTWFSPQGNDTASLVTVGQGRTSGIDARLPAPGTITGVVFGSTGQPLAGVCAFALGLDGEPSNSLAQFLTRADPATSNRNGVYRITGLAAGRYGIEFVPCDSRPLGTVWYRHSADFAGPTPVVVKSGHVTTDISEQMLTGQSITGRIAKARTRQVVAHACVFVTDTSADVAGFSESKKDGTYRVSNLAAGTYDLQVGPCVGTALATVMRTHVKVGFSRPTQGVDVALPVPGRIAGRVTGGNPARPSDGTCVLATPKTGHGTAGASFTRPDGTYSLGGLAPGRYRVEFSTACDLSPGGFAPQWFDHRATSAGATTVGVRSAKVTAGIDARLAADGKISGSVKVSGKPQAGVCALAFPKASGKTPTVGVTDAKGSYLIGGLPPGRYLVEFTGGCGVASYRTQWFKGASSRNGAHVVIVKVGSRTTNINAR